MSDATFRHGVVHVRLIGVQARTGAEASDMLLEVNDVIMVIVVGVAAFVLVMIRFG